MLLREPRDIVGLAQVDDVGGRVDLVLRTQPLGQRLELVAAAGGQAEVAAFLGEGFGRGGADALGGSGDEDALAGEMQIHGMTRVAEEEEAPELSGQSSIGSTLHCSVALVRRIGPFRGLSIQRPGTISMSSAKKTYRIAVIPGDGIGKEVMPEGLRVLEAAAKKHGVAVQFDHFDFSSYDYYEKHGKMMPDDWKEQIGKHDAIYFGAVGWPGQDRRSRFVVGLADQVPPRIRPVCQSAPGAPDAGRAVAAGGPQARRHRFLGRAREHRRRIFVGRRAHVRRTPIANS